MSTDKQVPLTMTPGHLAGIRQLISESEDTGSLAAMLLMELDARIAAHAKTQEQLREQLAQAQADTERFYNLSCRSLEYLRSTPRDLQTCLGDDLTEAIDAALRASERKKEVRLRPANEKEPKNDR